MNINGWFLKTLFTIFVVSGVAWLHFFIASDKLGDDILNSYALFIVVLSFYVKDENGKERETLKYYIDITTVIVSIAITFELVYVKLYDKGEPMDFVKGIEMFLCAWIFYGVFIAKGKIERKVEDTQ